MKTVRTAQDGQRIWTRGLDTCVAIIVVGTLSTTGGIAKVMAHMSTGRTEVMQAWFAQVQASGTTNIVMYISQPDPSRNRNPDPVLVQEMATDIQKDYDFVYNLLVSSDTPLYNFNVWVRNQAHYLMIAGFAIYQRRLSDVSLNGPGLAEMESSPTGEVVADIFGLAAY
ncbi:uncharacterized protein Bfra_006349 [Botrytis fragariae]|uniref:Uncharacterized protein n=1 Tax=Botrytis fragariae TaxID=1964551 RepID=A0A8H6B4M4_9HELO|nr:uncharacterized protein Bfra_006349 [Botrytis fragariae]KAF5879145.1 hypothetical protein Bfra_006349 [Botrytis fragariae]